jgi:predicted dehydrogenase
LRVLIIGFGSIGRRHARIVKEELGAEIICLRSRESEYSSDSHELIDQNIYSFKKIVSYKPDFAIISNPSSFHVKTAYELAKMGIPFLIEKPVSDKLDGLEDLFKLVNIKNLPVMVGFQLRFHPGYIKTLELIESGEIGRPLLVHGYVGQYLPDWRPGGDYRNTCSAKDALGGGVILDLCHEIDILVSILGKVKSISCLCGHYSDLEIDTEDVACLQTEHNNMTIGSLQLNYLEREYVWITRIMGTHGSIVWDYGNGYVRLIKCNGQESKWVNPDGYNRDCMFRKQLKFWLKVMEGNEKAKVDIGEATHITKVVLAAKKSSKKGKHIIL